MEPHWEPECLQAHPQGERRIEGPTGALSANKHRFNDWWNHSGNLSANQLTPLRSGGTLERSLLVRNAHPRDRNVPGKMMQRPVCPLAPCEDFRRARAVCGRGEPGPAASSRRWLTGALAHQVRSGD